MSVSQQATAPGGLSRLQVRKALRIWTVEGCVSTVQMTLTSGAFITGFALYLGCTNTQMGMIAAIPAFAGLLQLFSSYFAQRYGTRSVIVPVFAFLSRILWIPALLIPYVLPQPIWVPAFLALILLMSALGNVATPLWTAWMSDLVPEDYRGRYFGQRNMYAGLVGMVGAIVAGAFYDSATKRHMMSEPAAFSTLFLASCVCAVWALALGRQSPDIADPNAGSRGDMSAGVSGALSYYAAPFADSNFRRVIYFYSALTMAINIAGQFFTVYQISVLKLDYTTFQILAAITSLGSLAAMPLWGYLADKYGNKPILHICMVMVLLPPIMWCFTHPDTFPGLWTVTAHGHVIFSYSKLDIALLNMIAGLGWSGVGLTQFNIMIGVAPQERRTVYVSAISAVTGIAGGIAPLLGGYLLDVLKDVHFSQHGMVRNNYHVLFLVSALMRLISLGFLSKVSEEGSNTARYVIDQIKGANPIQSIANIQQLSKGSTATVRQQAAQRLAQLRTPVAVEELVRALDDVALPVREQAAVALGEIGDERAVAPLVRKLADSAAGITSVAASALGKIGSADAFPALAAAAQLGPSPRRAAAVEAIGRLPDHRVTGFLLTLLTDPDVSVRTATLRSIVEREDPEAEDRLALELATERSPELIAVIADGLGRFGGTGAVDGLLGVLERELPATVRRTVINAIGSIVGGRDALYSYLALDAFARDETVSKILSGMQKRFRLRGARAHKKGNGRAAVRARQALESYVTNDYALCVRRLTALGRLILQPADAEEPEGHRNGAHGDPGSAGVTQSKSGPVLEVLNRLEQRATDPQLALLTIDEVLLCLFLVRSAGEGG